MVAYSGFTWPPEFLMQVRHLTYFITLAREQHFARAAEACHISQPILSAAINKLEEDLQTRLVVRGHRFMGLTPEGEKVLGWAQQILSDYDNLRSDLAGLRRGLQGTLRLGVSPAAMPSVSLLTDRFCAAHPSARIEIQSMSSRTIQRGLDAFELDAGITYLENEPLENVRRIPLYQERYVFVAHPSHRFADRHTLPWAEAVQERLCLLSEDMQDRRIIDTVAASLGLPLQPAVVSNSFLAVCAHIRHGVWASIVPHTFFNLFGRAPDLVMIDLVQPIHSQAVGLVLSDREPLSPMASAVIASVLGADFGEEFALAATG